MRVSNFEDFASPADGQRTPKFNQSPPYKWLFFLWLISCSISLIGLGDLPIRDFDEATVAQVALELSKKQGLEALLPTLWDNPYINKPPGLHWLIAIAIKISEGFIYKDNQLPNEFIVRIIPAFLSTIVIPVGGLIHWQLRPNKKGESILAGSILLTLMPIIRHGRLAMLDGTQLTLIALFWLFILSINKKQNDYLKAFGIGLASSGMLLLKAPLLIPIIASALFSMILGNEFKKYWRKSLVWWISLGIIPGLSWHIFHAISRGKQALWLWGGDGATRVLFEAGEGSNLGWKVPVIEILEGGWPWLILWPFALLMAWDKRNTRWGRWGLGTTFILTFTILVLKTQLPWYSHPLWLPFALLCTTPIGAIINQSIPINIPGKVILQKLPLAWFIIGIILIIFGLIGFSQILPKLAPYSKFAFSSGIGWAAGGWLLNSKRKDKRIQGMILILSGSIISLYCLMSSSMWLWELNENWSVEPVARLSSTTNSYEIAIDGTDERPSLNWYARKRIRSLSNMPESKWILTSNPTKLIQKENKLSRECKEKNQLENWSLIYCEVKEK